jgi:hypothetical protein
MPTSIVLRLLKAHKEEHIAEFQKQLNGWKKLMDDFSLSLNQWANNTNDKGRSEIKRPKEPEKPVIFLETYDSLIFMLEHHEKEFISLDEESFSKIINDEFFWRHQFLTNSTIYTTNVGE